MQILNSKVCLLEHEFKEVKNSNAQNKLAEITNMSKELSGNL